MRLATTLIGLAALAESFAAAGPAASQADDDYALGTKFGLCIQAECQVFHGVLTTAAPRSGAPLTVRIEKWLLGPPPVSDTVQVPYEEFPDHNLGDGRLAWVWKNVNTATGTPVTVVYGAKKGLGVLPQMPVVVTSDEREMEIIRSLAEEGPALEGSPELISEAIASLSRVPNPALAGYIYMYLKFPKASIETDRWADLFWKLIQNPSVPPARWDEIAVWLVSCYDNLSPAGRLVLVSRLRELGQQQDVLGATIGVAGLAEIASRDPSVEVRIPAATLLKLRTTYAALVSDGSIYSNLAPLKALLGVK
jgi:hypothetical protein